MKSAPRDHGHEEVAKHRAKEEAGESKSLTAKIGEWDVKNEKAPQTEI